MKLLLWKFRVLKYKIVYHIRRWAQNRHFKKKLEREHQKSRNTMFSTNTMDEMISNGDPYKHNDQANMQGRLRKVPKALENKELYSYTFNNVVYGFAGMILNTIIGSINENRDSSLNMFPWMMSDQFLEDAMKEINEMYKVDPQYGSDFCNRLQRAQEQLTLGMDQGNNSPVYVGQWDKENTIQITDIWIKIVNHMSDELYDDWLSKIRQHIGNYHGAIIRDGNHYRTTIAMMSRRPEEYLLHAGSMALSPFKCRVENRDMILAHYTGDIIYYLNGIFEHTAFLKKKKPDLLYNLLYEMVYVVFFSNEMEKPMDIDEDLLKLIRNLTEDDWTLYNISSMYDHHYKENKTARDEHHPICTIDQ